MARAVEIDLFLHQEGPETAGVEQLELDDGKIVRVVSRVARMTEVVQQVDVYICATRRSRQQRQYRQQRSR